MRLDREERIAERTEIHRRRYALAAEARWDFVTLPESVPARDAAGITHIRVSVHPDG